MNKRRGNYGFLRSFRCYYPSWGGLLALLLCLLLGALVAAALQYAVGSWLGEYATLVTYVLMFIPPLLFAASRSGRNELLLEPREIDHPSFRPLGAVMAVMIAVVVTVAAGFVSDALTLLLPPMPAWLENALKQMTQGNFLVNFLSVCVAAPFFEEWLCRGMVLRGLLCNKVKPVVAIPASALFFALIHFNPWQAIPAFLIGCIMGWVYYRTGSLKLTMLMHFVNNGLALVASRMPGMDSATSWAEVMPTGLYIAVVSLSTVTVLVGSRAFARIELQE